MGMEKIEHVVLFMLENRSFDSLLGWLYDDSREPGLNIPPVEPEGRRFEGLYGLDLDAFTNTAGTLVARPTRGAAGLTVPSVNPGESFHHVNMQLYEKSEVVAGDRPTMRGYLKDYVNILEAGFQDYDPRIFGPMILDGYSPAQLPVLNGLAAHYAVCDRWFSSVPSQTNSNRAFSLCGTSLGLVDNGYLEEDPRREVVENRLKETLGDDVFKTATVWNALHDGGYQTTSDWMIFWQSASMPEKIHDHLVLLEVVVGRGGASYLGEMSSGALSSSYTYRLFPAVSEIPGGDSHFARVNQFHERARAGTLPRFSYIEPRWNIQETAVDGNFKEAIAQALTQAGNDYHPPGNVAVGEEFLREVYLSLIANEEAWNKTLLIITSDEAVGQFDHVEPPAATPPWGDRVPEQGTDVQIDRQYGFNFDRYGTRVPAVLVSPYIQRGTVFRPDGEQPYDHTSLIATVLKWLGLSEQIGLFGERTRGAPTFEGALTLSVPRTDARSIGFLIFDRKLGDAVHYYDRFQLRGESGTFVSTAEHRRKVAIVDPFTAYFPTMGSGILLHFEKSGERDSTGALVNGDAVKIITADAEVGPYNVLGNWRDSEDCYYLNDYLTGPHDLQQQWVIRRVDGSSPIRFGDEVTLVSRYEDQGMTEDGKYLRAKHGPSATWVVVPPEQAADGSRR